MRTPHQKKLGKEFALLSSCSTLVVVLLIAMVANHGIPRIDSMLIILLGCGIMGLFGYQLGTVLGKPTTIIKKYKSKTAPIANSKPKKSITKNNKTSETTDSTITEVTTAEPNRLEADNETEEATPERFEQVQSAITNLDEHTVVLPVAENVEAPSNKTVEA
jgi:hypothetical protein